MTTSLRSSLVEGVPSYYPQFGFRSASELGFERPDPRIPERAWMALPLAAYDPAVAGRVVYPDFSRRRPMFDPAAPGTLLAVRRPAEQYGGTSRGLERREQREAHARGRLRRPGGVAAQGTLGA